MFLNGTNYTGPAGWYSSGSFDVDKVGGRMVAGNWDGDAYDDIGMLYDAGNGSTRAFLWRSNGSSFSLYAQPPAFPGYSVANIGDRVAAGDVNNDGRDDIVVAYNTGGAFRLDVLSSGMNTPTPWYTSGTFTVSAVGNRFVVGDFDGDGDAEPAMFYDYGVGHARLFRWNSANGSFGLDIGWETASGYTLALVGGRMAADDVNGDGADDIVTVYDYGPDFRYHVFLKGYQYQGGGGWYPSGSFELTNVSDRLVLGRWW
jgi:hypothetical protein